LSLPKRQRNCRFLWFIQTFNGTAPKRRLMQQMPQHNRSIYAAEIDRFLRSAPAINLITSYFNNLRQNDRGRRIFPCCVSAAAKIAAWIS
jgi:hypothetical protein